MSEEEKRKPAASSLSHNAPVLERLPMPAGKTVFREGDEAYNAYFIEEGVVEVIVSRDGDDVVVAELGAGDIFGEMALLDNGRRSATVRVKENAIVVVITKNDLDRKIAKIQDRSVKALIKVLIKRLKQANEEQLEQYQDMKSFQNRIMGVMSGASGGISAENREKFRNEVMPLLAQVEALLAKYR